MFCFCAGGLQGVQFASVASPLFVMLLLRFVSGVPLQEKQAEARWGTTQEYLSYRARTNLLVPLPKCWGAKATEH
jgi:steroid 5-alpha reductase family enzyme